MDVVELRPREEQAERAEEPGERGHEHRRAAELLGEPGRVHRAGAAVGDQRELARVAALLGRDRAQRAVHARVRELVDAARRPRASVSPSGSATRATASSASSAEIAICPSATAPAGISPSTTLASVTVASSPPRP